MRMPETSEKTREEDRSRRRGSTRAESEKVSDWNAILAGALGGLAATLPMTLAMKLLQRLGDGRRRLPFPPHEVTMGVADRAGVRPHRLSARVRRTLTYTAHFGYGMAAGAAYPVLARRLPWPGAAKGAAFGLGVWAGSYLGYLPALRLWGPPAEQATSRRASRTSLLLVAAHLVWGGTLGLVHDALRSPSWRGARGVPRDESKAKRVACTDDKGPDGGSARQPASRALGRATAPTSRPGC
jgi:hypothetical protein